MFFINTTNIGIIITYRYNITFKNFFGEVLLIESVYKIIFEIFIFFIESKVSLYFPRYSKFIMIQFFPLKFPFLIFSKQKEEKGKKNTSRS